MINLYISLYPEKNIQRVNELVECLKRNSNVFDTIFVLGEQSENITFIPKELTNIVLLPVTVRPTFRTFFNAINNITGDADINCVSNSDIYFDELTMFPKENECWALTRYDVSKNGPITFVGRKDCTDSWLFKGKIRIPKFTDHWLGIPGCDNRQNWELMNVGYQISNPSLTIKSYHLHAGEKSYDGSVRIQRPYHFLPPIAL
jgi:hypothetical protein